MFKVKSLLLKTLNGFFEEAFLCGEMGNKVGKDS